MMILLPALLLPHSAALSGHGPPAGAAPPPRPAGGGAAAGGAASTASAPSEAPDYLAAAISVYETGVMVHHRLLPPPDTWALAAALIAKHTHNATWAQRAASGLEGFTDSWANATGNGTAKPFGYARSGFVGWALPLAYTVLKESGHEPDWDAGRLATFKLALDSYLSPNNEAAASGGMLELGNWNKGFQHLADAAAVLQLFPEIDRW